MSDISLEATPLIAQYLALKVQNPDCMLFFRVGDFYELFFEDAVDAARTIGLTLTKRGKHLGEDIPLAGVPVHAVDEYLAKLIQAGFRVAMAEQMEPAEEAKKRGYKSIVARDIVRIVTAGTLTEERLLTPNRPSRLCALAFAADSKTCAVACTDISTGQFVVRCVPADQAADLLVALQPAELLLPDVCNVNIDEVKALCAARTIQMAHYPTGQLQGAQANARIAAYYDVVDAQVFGTLTVVEAAAVASILYYIERTQKGLNVPLSPPQQASTSHNMLLDAATRANLEITQTLQGQFAGSLLHVVDETVTGAGARLLLDWVSQPTIHLPTIHARQNAVAFAIEHEKWRSAVRACLKAAPDIARALTRLSMERGGPRDMRAIAGALSIAAQIETLFARVECTDIALLQEILAVLKLLPMELIEHLNAALVDEPPLSPHDGGYIRAGFDAELDEIRSLRDHSTQIIAQMEANLRAQTTIRSLKIRHNNVLGYYIEVPSQFGDYLREDAQKRFILRQSLPNATRFSTAELAELDSKIASAGAQAIARESAIFAGLCAAIMEESAALKALHEALAQLDVLLNLAQVATILNWTRPRVDESLALHIDGGRHAVVERALKQANAGAFIANSLDLSPFGGAQTGQIALVTGPNMGGKSTFLRQNALIVLLAHIGSYVPATSAHIGVVDRIFSRVGASDDLARGRSTFMVEMVETAGILNQATAHSFVILDEIGRGTATWDGLSIAWAVLEHLHETNQCRTIFATHFHELTQLQSRLPRMQNLHVLVKEWGNSLVFLHQVAAGVADRSYGVHVAQKAGLPKVVVERARTLLKRLEKGMDRSTPANLLADLPLFAALEAAPAVEALAPWQSEIIGKLQALNPDELNPKAALELLYQLKGMVE